MALFGRSGEELIPLRDPGEAGIEAFEEKARAMGVVLGDDDVKAAVAMHDEFLSLQTGVQGLEFALSRSLFPTLGTLAGMFLQNQLEGGGVSRSRAIAWRHRRRHGLYGDVGRFLRRLGRRARRRW
jgi:hypothetical protein